jgi:hypothetical protein
MDAATQLNVNSISMTVGYFSEFVRDGKVVENAFN